MKIKAETRMRELLETEGIRQPDKVEYGCGCIRLFWHDSKTVVIVDIDDHGGIGESQLAQAPAQARPSAQRSVTRFPYQDRMRRN